jgi:hypothetical protein
MHDAVLEAALIEQLELRADVVRQGAFAATNHDRACEDMALVNSPAPIAWPASSPPATAMSAVEDSFSCRTASGSNSRSIRVLALDGV